MAKEEHCLITHVEEAPWDQSIGLGYCMGAVFAKDGIQSKTNNGSSTLSILKKNIENQLLLLAYSFGGDELNSKLEYFIRSL